MTDTVLPDRDKKLDAGVKKTVLGISEMTGVLMLLFGNSDGNSDCDSDRPPGGHGVEDTPRGPGGSTMGPHAGTKSSVSCLGCSEGASRAPVIVG